MVDEHRGRLKTAIKVYGHYRFRLGMESVQPGGVKKKKILKDKLDAQEAEIDRLTNELEFATVHEYEQGLD